MIKFQAELPFQIAAVSGEIDASLTSKAVQLEAYMLNADHGALSQRESLAACYALMPFACVNND